MAIMINPNAIQKGSITKEMLAQGARKPIILTPDTTEVDEETYQKLFPSGITTNDVDVMFRIGEFDYGLFLPLESTTIYDGEGYNELIFTGIGGGMNLQSIYIWAYCVDINTETPHQCEVTKLQGKALNAILSEAGYLNKSTLSPVLKEIDLTGTDAQRKAKLTQFEADWKALTGASNLDGARFVGLTDDYTGVFTYDSLRGSGYFAYAATGESGTGSLQLIQLDISIGSLTITPLFSHLEPVEIFTDNSVASKQKNIDNLNAYKSNLTELGVDTNKSFQVPFREGDNATFIGTLQYSVDTNTYIGVGCASDEDTVRIIRISSTGESTITNLALADNLSRVIRDLGMYPELEPVPLNAEVTGKYINSDGKYVDASDWNIASIGAVSLGNTYLLNMVSSTNIVPGVALFVSRVYKCDKEGKIIGTTLTPLFSAKNTSIPASGYVLFEAMDDYDEVLICYKPALTTQMLVTRWGFKASHATQLRNLRLIVDNKTDFEGIYELLTAGYALNLVGKGNGEPQAFLSRKTGGGNITDGSAVIKEVDGVQPIVWNQLAITPESFTVQGGSKDKFTVSILNNIITMTATSEISEILSTGGYCFPMAEDKYILGHRYFVAVKVNPSVDIEYRCHLSNDANGIAIVTLQANKWSRVSLVSTLMETSYGKAFFGMPKKVSVGDTIQLKEFEVTDLTQMFGAGNEPSTYEEYLDRISHYHIEDTYAYNAGEIVNYKGTGIKTTGRNLWDEEWESGEYDSVSGIKSDSSSRIRSVNYIPCFPNMAYYFNDVKSSDNRIYFFDANKNYLGFQASKANTTFTTPAGASYMTLTMLRTTYAVGDICINLSDPAFNGQYEPYKSYVRDWSEVMKKYFPDGMTSLNGVKDFFNDKKAVRKWGVVDLGSLSYYKGGNVWISIIPDYKTNTPNVYVNAFTTKYTQTIAGNEMSSVDCPNLKFYANAGGQAGGIGIRDDAYTTAESFKAAMAGVLLYYELSEPVEDIFEKPLNLTYTVINGGTETSLATENSTQFEGSIAYNKDYVAVVDELQMQNRVTQIEFENWEN